MIIVVDEPPSANRWWRKWQGRMVLSEEARTYKEMVGWECRTAVPIEGPVAVSIEWTRQRKSGDLDKRIGILLDSLQGVAFQNDSQVVEIYARRFDRGQTGSIEPGKVKVEIVGVKR